MTQAWRKIPLDARAFAIIAVTVLLTHIPFTHYGLCFNDPSWLFHFGRKTLHGATPYRDYVWQVGPLPVYVDAAFQEVLGEHYRASLYAALLIKIVRVSVLWAVGRRLGGVAAASALAVFCALDPLFSFAHDWSTPYADLSIVVSALCMLAAMRAEGPLELVYLALSGAAAALVIASRPVSALVIALLLAATTPLLLLRREYFTRARFVAFWGGFFGAVVVFALVLVALGAFGDAIQQMFIDPPRENGIHGIDVVLDAISGGALTDGRYTKLTGFLFFLGLPCAIIGGAAWLAARPREVKSSELALLLVPAAIVLGLIVRYADLEYTTDVPRTLFTAAVALAVLSPDRTRAWLGIEPALVIALAGLALASDWAVEMSFPGRGWGDVSALVTGAILLGLASSKIPPRVKLGVCVAFAVSAVIHTAIQLRFDFDPFAKPEATDGTIADNDFEPRMRSAYNPILRGIRVPEWRSQALEWLAEQVEPHRTCFVYGNLPMLYDLLDCANPTGLDRTGIGEASLDDVREALSILRAHPPDYLIAHERTWMSPAISLDLGGDVNRYESWNPQVSFELHTGLRKLAEQYESVGTVGEFLGPRLAKQASEHWDSVDAIRVYRRRR